MMKVQSPDLRARRPVRRKHVRAVYERVALAVGGRARYLLAMLLLIGSQVVNLAVPWLAAQAIDTVQTSGVEHIVKAGLITASIFLVYVVAWLMHGPGRISSATSACACASRSPTRCLPSS
jgi:ABC-type multidrug transport system fused ATPase/permease subunit